MADTGEPIAGPCGRGNPVPHARETVKGTVAFPSHPCPRHAARRGTLACAPGSLPSLRSLRSPPHPLSSPSFPGGATRPCGHKPLSPAARVGYNRHSPHATCLRAACLPCLPALSTQASRHRQARTGRAVQFNPFYPAGPLPRSRTPSVGGPPDKILLVRQSDGGAALDQIPSQCSSNGTRQRPPRISTGTVLPFTRLPRFSKIRCRPRSQTWHTPRRKRAS
jgi:hypothetical protein